MQVRTRPGGKLALASHACDEPLLELMWSPACPQAFPRAPPLRAQLLTTEFRCASCFGAGTRNADVGKPDMARQPRLPQLPAKRDHGMSCS